MHANKLYRIKAYTRQLHHLTGGTMDKRALAERMALICETLAVFGVCFAIGLLIALLTIL